MKEYLSFFVSVVFIVLSSCCSQKSKSIKIESSSSIVDQIEKSIDTDEFNSTIQWKTIEVFDSTIAYSKISRLGRVSVFLLSTPWCGPCQKLKNTLSDFGNFDGQVDFYYISMCHEFPEKKYEDLKKTDSYFFARYYDRFKEWPRVIITSPTGSIVKSFSHTDLERECRERYLYESVFEKENFTQVENPEKFKEELIQKCSEVSVYNKTIEILQRLLKFKNKFNINNVITEYSNNET